MSRQWGDDIRYFSGITEAGAFGYSIHPMYAISSKYESYKELDNSFLQLREMTDMSIRYVLS